MKFPRYLQSVPRFFKLIYLFIATVALAHASPMAESTIFVPALVVESKTDESAKHKKVMPITPESTTVMNISESSSNDEATTVSNKDNPIDPYENFNRNSFRMNQTLDKNFVRPATVWYITYIPGPVRSGVQNFFNNLRDFVTLGNDILQLNTFRGAKDTARVCINSTIGILGLIDVSSHIGLPEHINTFGRTMRFYGWEHSNYYMIPLLGPSTVRDALGMIPDLMFNPTWFFNYPYSNYVSVGLFMVNGIDQRSKFLDFDQTLNTSIDPYATVRDFYLQSSGNLPEEVESNSNEVKIDSLLDN